MRDTFTDRCMQVPERRSLLYDLLRMLLYDTYWNAIAKVCMQGCTYRVQAGAKDDWHDVDLFCRVFIGICQSTLWG